MLGGRNWSTAEDVHLNFKKVKLLIQSLEFMIRETPSDSCSHVGKHRIEKTVTYSHRIVWVGGDLWRSSSPAPYYSRLHRITSRWVFNNFRGEYSFSLGSLLQFFVTLKVKNFFLPIQM